MNEDPKDDIAKTLAMLRDNAYWRHYVTTLVAKRDAAVRTLLYSKDDDIQALRGEARAFDTLVQQLKRHGDLQ